MYYKILMLLILNLFIKLKILINYVYKWFLKVCNGFEINIYIIMYFNGLNCLRVFLIFLRLRILSIIFYVFYILCIYNSGFIVYMLEMKFIFLFVGCCF